ncbi:MAG: hypothetical protein C0403_00085 [Desulfobacterium sp.]|nr:hypothetical protein [Desulfobacterium sp.]
MKIEQKKWTASDGWKPDNTSLLGDSAQLVLVFASPAIIQQQDLLNDINSRYPNAVMFGCSTAGEIYGTRVLDDSLIMTAVKFENTTLKSSGIQIKDASESFHAGQQLVQSIDLKDLCHVFILSDGLKVNGSDLVSGIRTHLPDNITITGGLSGDGDRFQETFVLSGNRAKKDSITILGFYGKHIKIGYGSLGGWDPFGPERLITRSKGNILYELDGKSALELYKKYLGDHAKGLPATGLLFPLSLRSEGGESGLVRTILSVDEETQSMTFAGDLPEGSYARLMKANFNRLIDGAAGAAETSSSALGEVDPELAILISCVGRKMVLKQRIEEEVEAVHEIFGEKTVLTGFYSYGEISPFRPGIKCELHNQTMTITTISEI